jgi:hypothetical protein
MLIASGELGALLEPDGAYSLYVSQDSTGKAKLPRLLCWNCPMDAESATPTCREPFDMIFKRAEKENGRDD